MNLHLYAEVAAQYRSQSQKIRVLTERWVGINTYCPACGSGVAKSPNNSRVLDFTCVSCGLTFELKSKKGQPGSKVVNGAYRAVMDAITSGTQPNFFLLNYNADLFVRNLMLVPKRFIVPEIVEKRNPLAKTARRAGWVGCNLLVSILPPKSMIYYIKDGHVSEKTSILSTWGSTVFLDDINFTTRGWTIAVMSCVESLHKQVFTLEEMYGFVAHLESLFPRNRNVKPKIRQQLQILRDRGWLNFLGNGVYSLAEPTRDIGISNVLLAKRL